MTWCISLWQPWATLWASGIKVHETRHWRYPERLDGHRILIHAAKRNPTRADREDDPELFDMIARATPGRALPLGAFVGRGILAGNVSTNRHEGDTGDDYLAGNWSANRWAWKLVEAELFDRPIPARGQQGWWAVDEAEL